jgi:hypothetical protein
MAHYRTTPLHRARDEFAVLKACAGFALAAFAIAGLTGAAHAPDMGSRAAYQASMDKAALTRSGSDVIITGSIDNIFLSESFIGPNRAMKQDRARPEVALEEVTQGFEGIRAKIAGLRNAKGLQEAIKTAAAEDKADDAKVLETTTTPPTMPVAVAAVDPKLTTPALDAIEGATGAAPTPKDMSDKLAYARADLPATVPDANAPTLDKKGKKVSDKELWCMATGIYFEARGESYRGQVAVGQVIMNRVQHKLYPDSICGVVFQNQSKRNACQFSFACDGIPEKITEKKAWAQAQQIAKEVVSGKEYLSEVGYSTHYHATYVYPHWAPRMKKTAKIGTHVFYQFKRGWKFG